MKRTTAPWMGFAAFGVCIVILILANLFLPAALGLYATAIVEALLLILAMVSALISKIPLKEVFPIKKPAKNHIFAVILLYLAGIYTTSVITYLTGIFFPEQMLDTVSHMSSVMESVPPLIGFLIIAVMPAICEEALHRGFILHSFSRIRSTALILTLMGIIFGIFHLDPYRFLITGVMGALLSYLMLETRNMLIPALFHFLNNAVSFLSTSLSSALPDASAFSPLMLGLTLLLYGSAAPFLLYAGTFLLTRKDCRSTGKPFPHKKFLVIAGIIAGICVISGFLLTICGIAQLLPFGA